MLVKIHSSYRDVVAICDSELLGKTFEEGNRCLTLHENFFKGEEKSDDDVLDIIEKGSYDDYTFNIVGEKSVNLALKSGLIKPEGVFYIQSVPIALVLL